MIESPLQIFLGNNIKAENSLPIKTIIFCDPGIDDLLMLIQILSSSKYNVVGIVPVSGNTDSQHTTHNTLALCELLGKTEIPVYPGSDYVRDSEYQSEKYEKEMDVYGKNGLGNINLPFAKIMKPQQQNGVNFTVDALKKDKHLLIFTAPLTEPAKIFQQLEIEQPEAFENILAISMMGGVINSTQEANWPIDEKRFSEYNLARDAESSKQVFYFCNKYHVRILLAPLDLTHSILASESDVAQIKKVGNPAAELVVQIIKNVPEHYQKRYQSGPNKEFRQPLHDFHSSNCLLHPELYHGHWVSMDVYSNLEPRQMRITNSNEGNVFLLDSHYVHREQFFVLLAKDLEYFQRLNITEKIEEIAYTLHRLEKDKWVELKNTDDNLDKIELKQIKYIHYNDFLVANIPDTRIVSVNAKDPSLKEEDGEVNVPESCRKTRINLKGSK